MVHENLLDCKVVAFPIFLGRGFYIDKAKSITTSNVMDKTVKQNDARLHNHDEKDQTFKTSVRDATDGRDVYWIDHISPFLKSESFKESRDGRFGCVLGVDNL